MQTGDVPRVARPREALRRMIVLRAAVLVLSAGVGVCVVYRWIFALSYLLRRHAWVVAPPGPMATRFVVVIPAHDEEGVIAASIGSLRSADYPRDRVDVIVVADNCSD